MLTLGILRRLRESEALAVRGDNIKQENLTYPVDIR